MVKVEQFIRELCAIGERGFTVTRVAGYVASNAVDPDSLASYLCYRPTHYTRNLIYKCDLFELIAICWDVGQESQIHNHQNQNCWMAAPIGRLAIQNYRIARGDEAGGFCELVPSDRVEWQCSSKRMRDPSTCYTSRMESLVALRDRREQVIARLSECYATDLLDVDELDRRLDLAHGARTVAELDTLLADLAAPAAPTALVVAGSHAIDDPNRAERKRLRVVMSAIERKSAWLVPRHLDVRVLWGAAELDFRDASLGAGITTLDVRVTMGALDLIFVRRRGRGAPPSRRRARPRPAAAARRRCRAIRRAVDRDPPAGRERARRTAPREARAQAAARVAAGTWADVGALRAHTRAHALLELPLDGHPGGPNPGAPRTLRAARAARNRWHG